MVTLSLKQLALGKCCNDNRMTGVVFRAATPADAYALAELSILAGDGLYEFLLEELAPKEMLAGLMARGLKEDEGGFCWKHCFVAEAAGVVGMVNAYPAAWLQAEARDVLPEERVKVLDPIDQAQDWESFLLNGIAVRPQYRRQGIGKRLMQWALQQALESGFSRLSANVWADNAAARALCEQAGLAVQKYINVPQHEGLPHSGGSLLMMRQVEAL